jgi:sugar (pentulose or hexulose) kinase
MPGNVAPPPDESDLLLGVDIGTSRLKAAVYDSRLQLIQESSLDTRWLSDAHAGQLDAGALWGALGRQLTDLLMLVDARRITAIGIAGMAESGCLIDAASRPITPMLLWHDRRGVRQAANLRRTAGAQFARLTGLTTTNVRSIAKWMWMAEHGAPSDARWCGAPEWIALCLTGTWLTEATLAVRTGAWDALREEYSGALLEVAGAPMGLFPPVKGSPALAGNVLPPIARELGLRESVRVVIAGHDDIVAAYGAGGEVGDLIDSGGTAEGLIRIVEIAPVPAETVRARMAMARYYTPGTWALIAGAGSTGALMQLTAELLGREPGELDDIAAPPRQYTDGLIEVRLSKNALPTVRIKPSASPAQVWSAVLDLVCDRVEQTASRLERLAGQPSRLILIGGAARSRELVKRKSERLGLPALVQPGVDSTTRGAAALAGVTYDHVVGRSPSLPGLSPAKTGKPER